MQFSEFFLTKKIVLIRRNTTRLLCIAIFITAIFCLVNGFYKAPPGTDISSAGLQDIQIFSTAYPYFSYHVDKQHFTIFDKRLLFAKINSPVTDVALYDHYTFTFFYADRQQILLHYSPTLNGVYDQEYRQVEPSSELKEALLDITALYRQKISMTYGALLVREVADKIFPMYATAKIIDIYTGASFNVQRREGSSHADVQPLTAEDTAIMKQIYGGRWSWKRIGIIVEIRGYRIAASMHGMPHGSGKIADNNFPGHFCIHFLGSTSHGGGMDIQHHREILKAAGKLPMDDIIVVP